jgi:2-polyprenyl-3-methyl-5-hydroxy-6-metoxy-1,4-benzoquinol methylase
LRADDPRQFEPRFAFGRNWQSFVATVTDESIAEAKRGLQRLFPAGELKGRSFLDIGCGSGLSMLAAALLGARPVRGIDIDPQSVAATETLLSRHLPDGNWSLRIASVFDLDPTVDGTFDIVYSWGVLHHTGDMVPAIRKAAALVASGGTFAVALYRKTLLCPLWRREKRFYSQAGRVSQAALRAVYIAAHSAALLVKGRNPVSYASNYRSSRGMSWSHDVHDWLGGYPYESATPDEVVTLLADLGFAVTRMFEMPASKGGLFGSHCDEFVAHRGA